MVYKVYIEIYIVDNPLYLRNGPNLHRCLSTSRSHKYPVRCHLEVTSFYKQTDRQTKSMYNLNSCVLGSMKDAKAI